MDTLTQRLARHIAHTRLDDLPPAEIDAARMSLVDTIGCAVAARGEPGVREMMHVIVSEGANPRSTIWANGLRVSARQAAFANSVYGAALDYDSVFHPGVAHTDIIVVPVALAMAEATHASGRELLCAVAVGNDVLCRLSMATLAPRKGWFFSSVYGVMVAAGIAAKFCGADEKGIANAMGLASLNASGTYQPMAELSMSKRALAAFAAAAGVQCGQLAAAGFEGVMEGIEGTHGLFALYNDGDASRVTEGLGRKFWGSSLGRKPFPSCQCNHAPIEAALSIRGELGGSLDAVEHVDILLSAHGCRVVGAPYEPSVATQTAAQFSAQYSVACALVRGRLGIEEIQPGAIRDPAIARLVPRTRVVRDDSHSNTYVPATVVAHLKDGRTITRKVDVNRGAIELPLSREEMREKFDDCVRSALPSMSRDCVDALFAEVEGVDRCADVCDLTSRLAGIVA